MKRCPTCGKTFEHTGAAFCPVDGSALETATAPADALVGVTLDGKYRIESLLGAGGMGRVYKAHHLMLDRRVAVKMLNADMLRDSSVAERFRREAQASARLTHPNAVTIYDFGITPEGSAYLVMELLRGTSLRDLLARDRVLSYERAADVFAKVGGAIDRAHEQGIIHRDLKPDNIMVEERADGGLDVKVVDFGIAKFKDPTPEAAHLTGSGMIIGTVHYMSPEQCLGHSLDARSDIYSLGVVLYEALTGRVPFDSPTPSAIIVNHVNTPPPPPHEFRSDLPPAVERVILEAISKNPDERPASAGELARRLAAAAPRGTGASLASAPTIAVHGTPYSTDGRPYTTQAASGSHVVPSGPQAPYGTSGPQPLYAASGPHSAPNPAYATGPTDQIAPRKGTPVLPLMLGLAVLLIVVGSLAAALALFGLRSFQAVGAGGGAPSGPTAGGAAPASPQPLPSTPPDAPDGKKVPTITLPDAPAANEGGETAPDSGAAANGDDGEEGGDEADTSESTSGENVPLKESEITEPAAVMTFWMYGIMSKDLDMTMKEFADTVDYFSGGEVPKSKIRASYEKAFGKYDDLTLEVVKFHELSRTPDGDIRVVFDKKWTFTGSQANSTGTVKELLVLRRVSGELKIVKIQDLQTY